MKKVIIDTLKSYKWHILAITLLLGINSYLLTCPPKIIGEIIDFLYDIETNKHNILNYTYYLLGVCIVYLFVRIIWKYLETFIVRAFEKDLSIKLFQRFLKLKLKDIQNIKNGEIMSYFVKDINEIRAIVYRFISHMTRIVFLCSMAIFQMINGVNLYLTIAVIIPIIIGGYSAIKIKKYIEISFKKSQAMFTEMSEYIQESTDSIRTTKAYSCEGKQLKDFIRKNTKVRSSNNLVDVYSNLLKMSLNICFGLCYGISLLFGSKLVIDGDITVGELVAFNGYISLFVNPVTWLPQLITRFKRAQISYGRLDKIYKLKPEKINEKYSVIKEKLKGNIEIKNLSFSYPNQENEVLKNINLSISKGETIGIIGTIGSGKTTLVNLLTRLYGVEDKKILIDGKDINQIPIDVIRNNICYISQDNFLFSSTIKNNISLFKEDYGENEITESTKKAIVYDDISNMPNRN